MKEVIRTTGRPLRLGEKVNGYLVVGYKFEKCVQTAYLMPIHAENEKFTQVFT